MILKRCPRCQIVKAADEYWRLGDGLQSWCKDCQRAKNKGEYWNEVVRRYRRNKPEAPRRASRKYAEANPAKKKAHGAVQYAIKAGKLKRPERCESCDAMKPHAHHEDYGKPLDVQWLCAACHKAVHRATFAGDSRTD